MSKIFITTPSFNSSETIDATITSVLFQAGDFTVHYHVQDGGSTDGTVDLLKAWEERVNNGLFPLASKGVFFSYATEPDSGMYDAIVRGFKTFRMGPHDWMAWINSDDLLLPGSFAFLRAIDAHLNPEEVRWVTGASAISNDNVRVYTGPRPFCQDAIKNGLCDGKHWNFVQQEGTFFRNSLWEAIDSYEDFSRYKYAGDWNLWRSFAQSDRIYQTQFPLGEFFKREGQISQSCRDQYDEEINSTVSVKERVEALRVLSHAGRGEQLVLQTHWASKAVSIAQWPIDYEVKYWVKRVFGEDEESSEPVEEKQSAKTPAKESAKTPDKAVASSGPPSAQDSEAAVVGYDADWQFPAITEKQAYTKAVELLPEVPGVVYFGFPWATLIDRLANGTADAEVLKDTLYGFRSELKKFKRVVTVCQHILMLDFQDLFIDLGVTDIFWTHAVKGQESLSKNSDVRIHPFPLFPVQALDSGSQIDPSQKKYLFSFIGAKANDWYLTNSRELILEHLGQDERGLVVGREKWHYEGVVYQHQIFKRSGADDKDLIDNDASQQFKNAMALSLFSLCPSGSGPNSIRLWESFGSGVIPVVLADTYLPPGDQALWEEATVSCAEKLEDILALPDRLEALSRDEALLERKRKALRQLWMLYGPDHFVYDIQKLFISLSGDAADRTVSRQSPSHDYLIRMAQAVLDKGAGDAPLLRTFVLGCCTRLMINSSEFVQQYNQSKELRRAYRHALASCDIKHVENLERVLQVRDVELK
ncbi:exostosin family protein [uncultured Desulfuromonas sp.]|uniref:exostosin domain-containing protein n=1 Tax=uncultured Desulfuromonas sp. TaxID=181013 RepID=UPI00260545A4|nr:exostosin family protein [uncultured Desulfuromonas sp.]